MSDFWETVAALGFVAAFFGACAYAHSIPDSAVISPPRVPLAGLRRLSVRVSARQVVIVVGALLIATLVCYVPWTYTLHTNGIQREKPAGYHFLFAPPEPEREHPAFGVKVDWFRVLLPMVAVICATVAGVTLTGEKARKV